MRKSIAIALASLLLCLTGCSLIGTNPSAPTATEGKFFNTVTNYIPVVVLQTNMTTLTNTVIAFQTNTVGQVVTVTNLVSVPVPQIYTVTNQQPVYTLTPNTTTTGAATTAGTVANLVVPGSGGIVTLGITLLAGLYGYLRSYKNGQTGNALSQEMETVMEFVKALPNGATYKNALTNFLAAHQAEVGVVSQVTSILANDVSNPDAKVAAQQVINSINALQTAAAVAPVPAPVAPIPPITIGPVSLTTPPKVG